MIDVQNISVNVAGKRILKDVSLGVAEGQKAVIYGESGSGKTTLLRAMIGLHRINSGKILIDGLEVASQNIEAIREKICYVPQQFRVFDIETAREFINFPLEFKTNRGKGLPAEKIPEMLERFNLDAKLLDSRMNDLSGGEKQRMALIRGLMLDRPVLLLDEVTSAVDSENKSRVMQAVLEDRELTVLAITHDKNWIEKSSVKIELEKGTVVNG